MPHLLFQCTCHAIYSTGYIMNDTFDTFNEPLDNIWRGLHQSSTVHIAGRHLFVLLHSLLHSISLSLSLLSLARCSWFNATASLFTIEKAASIVCRWPLARVSEKMDREQVRKKWEKNVRRKELRLLLQCKVRSPVWIKFVPLERLLFTLLAINSIDIRNPFFSHTCACVWVSVCLFVYLCECECFSFLSLSLSLSLSLCFCLWCCGGHGHGGCRSGQWWPKLWPWKNAIPSHRIASNHITSHHLSCLSWAGYNLLSSMFTFAMIHLPLRERLWCGVPTSKLIVLITWIKHAPLIGWERRWG